MAKLKTTINTGAEAFAANRAAMSSLVADLEVKRTAAAAGGPPRMFECDMGCST